MAFDVTMEGFSGPLDLLCSLVESRAIAASRVRVSDVVRLYGTYLARGDVMTIREMAEFFALRIARRVCSACWALYCRLC